MSYRDYSTTNKTRIDDKQFVKDLKNINSDYLLKKQYLKSYLNLIKVCIPFILFIVSILPDEPSTLNCPFAINKL